MKKLKRIFAVLLCLVMIQAPVQIFMRTAEVQAAMKKEVKYNSKNGKYYYYENGKKVNKVNKWVTDSNGQKYYFGSKGYAFAAPKEDDVKYNVIIKKIGSRTYGFDNRGRMVKNGLYYALNGNCYYFNSKGVYLLNTTKKYRALAPTGYPAEDKKSVTQARNLLNKIEKPIKEVKNGSSCIIPNGTDYRIIYKHFEVQYAKDNKTKQTFVTGIWPR